MNIIYVAILKINDRIKDAYGASGSTIAVLLKDLLRRGWKRPLEEAEKPPRHCKVTNDVEARIYAIVCSEPSDGASR